MARNISRNPNQILRRKPNQFSTARFQEINWGRTCPLTETDSNDDQENSEDTTGGEGGENSDKLQYLRDRFNKPTCECPTGPKRETGQGTS